MVSTIFILSLFNIKYCNGSPFIDCRFDRFFLLRTLLMVDVVVLPFMEFKKIHWSLIFSQRSNKYHSHFEKSLTNQ